ncbi:PTS sugar transporter subunit IIA [Alicyclobacillus acidocaldarius]|uniref:Mannitol-specific phosphotransferase enzyme IIA component n=1 Tax=Alicyclobacillus acidocaldarius subsp. acidocaldarius (strain ATCC 27009 / DSM 446 / BCRC 14685 / JCM 5260 / KCTC 1825 / NBRC 15652 / NCIMB 11725 / NRRL B-14509 / 104-IA) TaxID=521098 RepID=C8WQV7_ALIAD|nr:PTS sugar transporter subunit IIA [Alicyclobacillus acidocaldarius]ACV57285.1 Protein-N(pi)-phosphohistidine--sugarphosphotran sferase [Alicyclobacillus acidocaldarius subsp. acidocaldarius DSM 446]
MVKLDARHVALNLGPEPKEDAIRRVGRMLVDLGHVEAPYVDSMLEREASTTTYIGNGIAIPHGMPDSVKYIRASGIVVAQYPDGVDFGGEKARLVIGIAGKGEEHMELLSQIATVCMDEDNVARLVQASSADEIVQILERAS